MMRKRLTVMLATLIPFGLAPVTSLAEGCGDYPLTQDQSDYIASVPGIIIPTGDVPFVQRCDVDGNNVINNDDLSAIRAHLKEPAAHPDDPMDWDGNGIIHGRDVGGCASSCTSKGCSVMDDTAEAEGFEAASELVQNTVGESGACYQIDDFDGDGTQDFVGIYEYTGSETRSNNWNLQTVILTQDSAGAVQHVTYPYTGQLTYGSGDLLQHLSPQPAGVIDLLPGSVTISRPGVVSYRYGRPNTLFYYFDNGELFDNWELTRAFYGVDD